MSRSSTVAHLPPLMSSVCSQCVTSLPWRDKTFIKDTRAHTRTHTRLMKRHLTSSLEIKKTLCNGCWLLTMWAGKNVLWFRLPVDCFEGFFLVSFDLISFPLFLGSSTAAENTKISKSLTPVQKKFAVAYGCQKMAAIHKMKLLSSHEQRSSASPHMMGPKKWTADINENEQNNEI